jgi:hypothetical protein
MAFCATRGLGDPTCKSRFEKEVTADLRRLGSKNPTSRNTFASLFRSIERAAPDATIAVMGYPRLFPKAPPKNCGTGVPTRNFLKSDMVWLNRVGAKLDKLIMAAARTEGFVYVDLYDAFNGHELCTANRYLNRAITTLNNNVKVYSFHPNAAGQLRIAEVVANAL